MLLPLQAAALQAQVQLLTSVGEHTSLGLRNCTHGRARARAMLHFVRKQQQESLESLESVQAQLDGCLAQVRPGQRAQLPRPAAALGSRGARC